LLNSRKNSNINGKISEKTKDNAAGEREERGREEIKENRRRFSTGEEIVEMTENSKLKMENKRL